MKARQVQSKLSTGSNISMLHHWEVILKALQESAEGWMAANFVLIHACGGRSGILFE